jgi:hypothetical protein
MKAVSTVEEIKSAIENLSLSERGELVRWLHGWQNDAWDHQISSDAVAGKLNELMVEVDQEIDQGKLRELP